MRAEHEDQGGAWSPPGWLEGGSGSGEHEIPLVAQPYEEGADREDWKQRCTTWASHGRKHPSVLGRYEPLAEQSKRFIVLWRDQPGYGWPEAQVALHMSAQGFVCWTGVQFFSRFGWEVNSPLLKKSTEDVFQQFRDCGIHFPTDYYRRLDAANTMRNPDVVCFHPERREWRFIEAKYKDPIDPRQLNALAFLHAVTGGDVEVRRVVPTGTVLRRHIAGTGRFTVSP